MADILVVDEDAAAREAVAAALRAGGHRVAEAADGVRALAEMGGGPADVVVLDLSLLRRAGHHEDPGHEVVADRDVVVDATRHEARLAGRPLTLTAREFELLRFLVGHPDEVWSREVLLREVWGWSFGDPSTVTVHVRRLRAKVEDDPTRPSRLVTVWGLGYRWTR